MKYLFSITLTFVVTICWAQVPYTINGSFDLKSDNNKIYLKIWKDPSPLQNLKPAIDSAIVINSKFNFNGFMPYSVSMAKLYFENDGVEMSFNFVVDSGSNFLALKKPESNSANIFSNTDRPSSLSNLIYSKIDSINNYYLEHYGSYVEDLTNGEKIWVLNNREKSIQRNKDKLALLTTYPNSLYSMLLLYGLLYSAPFNENPIELMDAFQRFTSHIQESLLARKFYKECAYILSSFEGSKIGESVPEFSIKTINGKTFYNKSLKGQNYIIAFSATWCIPCQYYKKKLIDLYTKYGEKRFRVVYFNLDDNVERWKKEVKEIGFDWIFVSERKKFENSHINTLFNVHSIPSYFLVDRDGIIRYNSNELKDEEFDELEKYLQRLN